MYYTDEDMSDTYSNFDVNGARSHMSWETSRDGLWTLRPASGLLPGYMRR
jgi:hypothetical protein